MLLSSLKKCGTLEQYVMWILINLISKKKLQGICDQSLAIFNGPKYLPLFLNKHANYSWTKLKAS